MAKVIPLVLHKVVQSTPSSFEDVSVDILKYVLSMDSARYITADDLGLTNLNRNQYYYMLTFDDGFLSDYEIVFPLLLKHGIRATFFINPENVGRLGYVSWDMLKEMHGASMIIGSHGYRHSNMTLMDKREAKSSLCKSKDCIENALSCSVDVFSFPYGKYSARLVEMTKLVGYRHCFSSQHGIIGNRASVYPRNSINSSMDFSDINRILNLSLYMRLVWKVEDILKILIKQIFGDEVYVAIRKRIVFRK